MPDRRQQLVRILNRRRRRMRLLLACMATAMACGLVAGIAAPRILIGGVSHPVGDGPAAPAPRKARDAQVAAGLLDLSESLGLDPRETQANTIRWQGLSQPQRRAILDRYWELAEMSEDSCRELLGRYAAFRELSPERQEYLRSRARKLRQFMKTLSPQDQAVLGGMTEEARAQRLLELWRARYGTW